MLIETVGQVKEELKNVLGAEPFLKVDEDGRLKQARVFLNPQFSNINLWKQFARADGK